ALGHQPVAQGQQITRHGRVGPHLLADLAGCVQAADTDDDILLVDIDPSTAAVEDFHEAISQGTSSPSGHPRRAVCSACSLLGQGQQFRMRDDVPARLVYGLAAPSMTTASFWRRGAIFSITNATLTAPIFMVSG